MASSTAQQKQPDDKDQGIEYSIYTLDKNSDSKKSASKWNKHSTASEMSQAIALAEKLIASDKYQKVEVKQKYFDKAKNRDIDVSLKKFEHKPKLEISVMMVFMFAVVCGVMAFIITFFLTGK